MPTISFADVVHQTVSFTSEVPAHRVVLDLIETPWVQRLRDIRQTGNTRLVYMFSEHSRFGHSVGVAALAIMLMERLKLRYPEEVAKYEVAVAAAALLHDVGHLAPGSHTAFMTLFPSQPDTHEEISNRVIREDPAISEVLARYGEDTASKVCAILDESSSLPPWTWEIISGGGWNVDRGNWSIVDSTLAGVSYGKYNIPALLESIVITDDKHLALKENRLDAMMHFVVSRHAMYRQVYQHRVMLAADCLGKAVIARARDIDRDLYFRDPWMDKVLSAQSPSDLGLDVIFRMRESWFAYHLMRWLESPDATLRDLASRIVNRTLLKTVRVRETDNDAKVRRECEEACLSAEFDPKYYLHAISTGDMHAGDFRQSMMVLMDDGRLRHLSDAEPLFAALVKESRNSTRSWFALPKEAKSRLGRLR